MNHYIKQESNNWNELVFENRNKAYGAYVIRESYDRTLFKSYLIVLATLAFLSGVAISISKLSPQEIEELADRTTTVITEIFPPEILPPDEIKPATSGSSNQSTAPPVITNRDRDTSDEPTDTSSYVTSPAGPVGEPGLPVTGLATSSSDPATTADVEGSSSTNAILVPDELPEFPGGLSAMHRFIQERLRISSDDIPVERARIVVTFVVDPQGKITDLKPVSKNGFGMEESLMRTVEQMPEWKPGKKNNHAVYVRMMLPVTYEVH